MENPEVDRELASDETPDPIAISAEPKEEGHSSQVLISVGKSWADALMRHANGNGTERTSP